MCLPRRHSRLGRLASGAGVSAIVVIRRGGHGGVALMSDDGDELGGVTFHSLHDDIEEVSRPKARSGQLHEREHARRVAMPCPVVFVAEPVNASLASHRPGDGNGGSGVRGDPTDRRVEAQPTGFHQLHLSRP